MGAPGVSTTCLCVLVAMLVLSARANNACACAETEQHSDISSDSGNRQQLKRITCDSQCSRFDIDGHLSVSILPKLRKSEVARLEDCSKHKTLKISRLVFFAV